MRKLLRQHKWKVAAFSFIGVPATGITGLALYIKYREKTKPSEVVFKPLVSEDGSLVLNDITIAAPTTWQIVKRLLTLLYIFVPVFVKYVFVRWHPTLLHRWMEELVCCVERAGPAFVKCGQWTCTRKDLFGDEFRRVFERLYCEVATHPMADTLRIIEEDLKVKPEEVFESIEPVPCGSGSIGQVHVARMRHTSEKVVIKVMHPSIVETIAQDFYIINGIARFIDTNFRSMERYDIRGLALAFTNHLAAQLDFRIEAEHLELFREHFKGVDYVVFPKPLFSTMRVLVETFASGQPATPDFLRSQEEHVRDMLATKGLNCWCKMLLRDNFIHGDMHPGNILIDTSDPHKPIVTMIDVGLCQKLTGNEGPITFNLMDSFVHWKSELCTDTLLSMGTEQRFCDKKKFGADMHTLFERYRPATDADDQVVTNILESIFDVVRDNHVQMDPPYVSLLFAVLVLESFIMNLNPDFNMVRHAAPWLVSEGHVSPGLVRNIILSKVDHLSMETGALRGRLRDSLFGSSSSSSGAGDAAVNASPTSDKQIFIPAAARVSHS